MLFYLCNGFGIHIKFETKRGSLVFLTGVHIGLHALMCISS